MPRPDRKPLLAYLKVQEGWERDLLVVLRQSAARVEKELKAIERAGRTNISTQVRTAQLQSSLRALKEEQAALWRTVGSSVAAGREEAAAAAVRIHGGYEAAVLNSRISKQAQQAIIAAREATARSGVEAVTARMTRSQLPLSDKVYRTQALVTGKIDRLVYQGLATNASAARIAADVRGFIDPRTPGGVKYAAQRLGRTEINNAFHAMQVEEAERSPFTTGVLWQVSGSHPEPDECDDYSGTVYAPRDVPLKPHPQCLCYTVPQTLSRDDFIKSFQRGEYDSYLGS